MHMYVCKYIYAVYMHIYVYMLFFLLYADETQVKKYTDFFQA